MGEETDIAEPMSTEDVVAAEDVTADEPSKENPRKRKKHLYKSLRELLEFYMGDVNLSKDRFMSERIQGQPFVYVDLSLFLTFNKVRALTLSVEDLAKALSHSEILQVSDDGTRVCRKTPILRKENEDECTIYVEQLPQDIDHEMLTKMFSEYGTVDYVSMPRFSHSSKFKGFAFVEFKDPECAKRAIEAFKIKGCCLSPQMAPEELMSIKNFDHNKENKVEKAKSESDQSSTKHKINIGEKGAREAHKVEKSVESKDSSYIEPVQESDIVGKERKKRKCDTDENLSKKIKLHHSRETESSKSEQTKQIIEEDIETTEKNSGKYIENVENKNDSKLEKVIHEPKSKEEYEKTENRVPTEADYDQNVECEVKLNKKKQKRKRPVDETVDHSSEVDNIDEEGSEPKRKKLKSDTEEESEISQPEGENDETAKQKKKRKRKKKIKKEKSTAITLGLKVLPKKEWKSLRNRYLNMQRDMMRSLKQQLMHSKWDKNKAVGVDSEQGSSKQIPKFSPETGIVVKVTLGQPISSQAAASAKSEMRIHPDIRYVDVTEGSPVVYLRAATPQLAASLVQTHHWPVMEIIQGDEETEYWNKMNMDREEKLKKIKLTHQRGRTKLLKRAERFQNKHITTFEPS